jgi:hypothetical protein
LATKQNSQAGSHIDVDHRWRGFVDAQLEIAAHLAKIFIFKNSNSSRAQEVDSGGRSASSSA